MFLFHMKRKILLPILLLGGAASIAFAYEAYHSKPINWQPCKSAPGFDCGFMTVPYDYNNLKAGSTQLAVTIHRATGTKKGTIFYNYGGPWDVNVQELQKNISKYSPRIVKHYDLVTFTPRGMLQPAYLSCSNSDPAKEAQIHQYDQKILNAYASSSNESTRAMRQNNRQLFSLWSKRVSLCQYPKVAKYMSTFNTLKDMDTLRKDLGVNQILYYGRSYGTLLGLGYLVYYPQHVKRMVIDSNLPANHQWSTILNGWAKSNEQTFDQFFQFCAQAKSKCALYDPSNGLGSAKQMRSAFSKLLDKADKKGIPTNQDYGYRPMNGGMLSYLITIEMVEAPEFWPGLADALHGAITQNNANALIEQYQEVTSYDAKTNAYQDYSSFDNGYEVGRSVFCSDFNVPYSLTQKGGVVSIALHNQKRYPLLGGNSTALFGLWCVKSPTLSKPLIPGHPKVVAVHHKPKVLVVNNQFDPRTPVFWAKDTTQYIGHKLGFPVQLLVYNGAGHISYAAHNTPTKGCIDQNVTRFITSGQFPSVSRCNDQVNPFLRKEDN